MCGQHGVGFRIKRIQIMVGGKGGGERGGEERKEGGTRKFGK